MSDRTLNQISMSEIMEPHLAHYGVPGMHWGIRNDRQQRAADRRTVVKNMNDQELQNVINRMRLERQYNDLTANRAAKTGRQLAARYATQTLNLIVTTALTVTVGAFIKQKFSMG